MPKRPNNRLQPDSAISRVQLSFTLKPGVKDRLLSYCKDNMINKSLLVEKLIIEHFERMDFEGMEKHE